METVLVFPHQLFQDHPAIEKNREIFLIEHPRFFTDFAFHKQKLMLHRASMKWYYHDLKSKKYHVHYIEFSQTKKFLIELKKKKFSKIMCVDVVDHLLEHELHKIFGDGITFFESPSFLSSREWLEKTLGDKDHYVMNSFYIQQRKHLDILVSHGKPKGGKWSFDTENRLKMPKTLGAPQAWQPQKDAFVKEAYGYVEKHFSHNPGSTDSYAWPINHLQAQKGLHDFLHNRLTLFGPYQDAIDINQDTLFHSLLSSSLNNGLLTPADVISQTITYSRAHQIPLNSLEGFIRQIIGWREFVRGIYLIKGKEQSKSNFFNHKRKLPKSFWTATTGVFPLDHTITKVLKYAYAHHIERLMIMGNFMLLARTDPDEVYKWFMELFIDAYDWVMVPNVYGMSQYADGGLMTTKPYFSGSNYVRKMSNYPKGDWWQIWDALYWAFIYDHRDLISKNARLSIMATYLRAMKKETLKKHLESAEHFLKKIR